MSEAVYFPLEAGLGTKSAFWMWGMGIFYTYLKGIFTVDFVLSWTIYYASSDKYEHGARIFQEIYFVDGRIGLFICLFIRLYIASGADDSKQFTVQYALNQELKPYIVHYHKNFI